VYVDGLQPLAKNLYKYSRPQVRPSLKSHGDIISWDGVPPPTENERKEMARVGLSPEGAKRRVGEIYTESKPLDIVAWRGTDREVSLGLQSNFKESHKGGRHLAPRDAGFISKWAGGEFVDSQGNAMPPPDKSGATYMAGYGGTHGGKSTGDLLPDVPPLAQGALAWLRRARRGACITRPSEHSRMWLGPQKWGA
jgi:hypothetical protein